MQGGLNMAIDMEATWLRVGELAEHYQVGPEAIRRWVRDGKLRAVRIGREWRIRPEWVTEFEAALERIGGQP